MLMAWTLLKLTAILRESRPSPRSQAELRDFLKDATSKGKISKWAIPHQIILVNEIPKTRVGKIDKNVIRQEMLE
jgi:fatty-acyl-CoA synthase